MRESRAWKIGCRTCSVQVGRETNLVEKGPFIYFILLLLLPLFDYLLK